MIAIGDDLRAAIYAHARAAFPAECCGYLTGRADRPGEVDAAVACTNAADDPATGFALDGRELLVFARSFDGPAPARVVYHSHPNGRAYFSATDHAAHGGYPVEHVVVGLTAAGIVEVAQFAAADDGVVRELARWRPAAAGAPR